jgi:hypothetical protein
MGPLCPTFLKGRKMKICMSYDYPPIPVRSADWCAWVDGTEEDALCGRGETRLDALVELAGLLAAEDDVEGVLAVAAEIIHDIAEAKSDGRNTSYVRGLEAACRLVEGLV